MGETGGWKGSEIHPASRPSSKCPRGDHRGRVVQPVLCPSRSKTLAAIKRETFETVEVDRTGDYQHPLVLNTAQQVFEKTQANEQGWIVPPHGALNVKVSRAQLARALSIVDALFRAAEKQGWQPTTEFRVPRRRSVVGTFWYPGVGWTQQLPTPRRAEMGVLIRRQFVSFSIIEGSRQVTPTPADVRAWRKQWPYGVGGRLHGSNPVATCCWKSAIIRASRRVGDSETPTTNGSSSKCLASSRRLRRWRPASGPTR